MKLWFERGAWASRLGRRKIAALRPETVRKIAVIRHAALGDMVLVRPFLRELRRHFPDASLTLSVVSNYMYGIPEELIDRLHVIPGSDQRQVPRREQLRQIRALGYHDLLFDQAATTRSHWVSLLNPAAVKIGFPYRSLPRRLIYDAAVLRSDFRFEAETLLDMLHLLGYASHWPLDYDLPGEPLQRDNPYLVYFPSASTPDKCWPQQRFAELIGHLADKLPGHDHLVLEGLADWENIETIMVANPHHRNVIPLGASSLEDTISLLKGAALLVSNDTGIRNLAIAAGTPTVGIFFNTVPFRYWPRDRRHQAVFEADGGPPGIDAVETTVLDLMGANQP